MKKVIYLLSFFLSANLFAQTTGWKQLPEPAEGIIQQVETGVDNTIFVKTSSGLLYCSADGGNRWRPIIPPSALSPWISVITFTLTTDNTGDLFICVQNNNSAISGVYRSHDKGDTWEQLLSGVSIHFMVRSATGNLFAVRSTQNLTTMFESKNDGTHWDSVDAFPFQALDFTVNHNEVCYFTLLSSEKTVLKFDVLSGLHESVSPSSNNNPFYYSYICLVGNLSYVRYFDEGYTIKTDNTMERRSSLNPFNNQQNNNPLLSSSDGTIYTLTSSSNYASDFKITYSTDLGTSWQQFTSAPGGINYSDVRIALDSSGNFYLGTPSGIYKTKDKGGFWKKIGLPVSNIAVIKEGPEKSLFALDGYYYNNYYYLASPYSSQNEGSSWEYPYLYPESGIGVHQLVQRDADGGFFFFNYHQGNPNSQWAAWHSNFDTPYDFKLQSLLSDPPHEFAASQDRFYALFPKNGSFDHYILFTSDKGITWEQLDIPATNASLSCFNIDSSGTIYIGYAPSLYKSEDNGNTWIKIPTGLKISAISTIKFFGSKTIILGTQGAGIWHSTDGGTIWERWDPGLRDTINAIEFFRGRCYAASTQGMISCNLISNNWQNELFADEYLPILQILNYENKRLYTSVANLGIWTSDSSLNGVRVEASEYKKLTVLSDPYIPSTSVRLDLDKPEEIKLDIYNILGNRIMTLADEFMDAGEHTIPIQTSSFPSGTYTVVLTTTSGSETGKFIFSR